MFHTSSWEQVISVLILENIRWCGATLSQHIDKNVVYLATRCYHPQTADCSMGVRVDISTLHVAQFKHASLARWTNILQCWTIIT